MAPALEILVGLALAVVLVKAYARRFARRDDPAADRTRRMERLRTWRRDWVYVGPDQVEIRR